MGSIRELKCPNCCANLSPNDKFCTYCGTKVSFTDGTTITHRTSDEAEVIRAETDRIERLEKLKIEEEEKKRKRKITLIWVVSSIACCGIGALLMLIDWSFAFLILGGVYSLLLCFSHHDGKKDGNNEKNTAKNTVRLIEITESIADWEDRNVEAMLAILRGAGFKNINAIPLHDLSWWSAKKNGRIESMTINGDSEFEEGDSFPPSVAIVITYHSLD